MRAHRCRPGWRRRFRPSMRPAVFCLAAPTRRFGACRQHARRADCRKMPPLLTCLGSSLEGYLGRSSPAGCRVRAFFSAGGLLIARGRFRRLLDRTKMTGPLSGRKGGVVRTVIFTSRRAGGHRDDHGGIDLLQMSIFLYKIFLYIFLYMVHLDLSVASTGGRAPGTWWMSIVFAVVADLNMNKRLHGSVQLIVSTGGWKRAEKLLMFSEHANRQAHAGCGAGFLCRAA